MMICFVKTIKLRIFAKNIEERKINNNQTAGTVFSMTKTEDGFGWHTSEVDLIPWHFWHDWAQLN